MENIDKLHTKTPHNSIEWSAPEYTYKEKSADWYWILGIITIVLAVGAVFLKNMLFAVFILLAGFVLGMYSKRRPETVAYSISQRGVRIGGELYPYQTLETFWVDETDAGATLLIESNKPMTPLLLIPLGDTSTERISNALSSRIKEDPITMPFTQLLMDRLGF